MVQYLAALLGKMKDQQMVVLKVEKMARYLAELMDERKVE